jgi:hypothetical protein
MRKASHNSTAVLPSLTEWPWLRYRRAAWFTLVFVLLGILSFAAVASVECRDKPSYLLTTTGGRMLLADGPGAMLLAQKSRQCQLKFGYGSFPLPGLDRIL